MGSAGNQNNPWTTYDTYKDCSQGICSIYCPQWCYIVFPPPPPFSFEDDGSATDFSPLIIAVIGVFASAFILVSYYTIISKYCRRRNQSDSNLELNENQNQVGNDSWQVTAAGLDETLIKSITVCKYKKGEGFIDGTDCSVCLSEFQENESLRLLPKCNHAFHIPCIDTWLKSHASCPLCRAHIAPAAILPPQAPVLVRAENTSGDGNVSALEYRHRSNDAVVVVQDLEGSGCEEHVVTVLVGDDAPKTNVQDLGSDIVSESREDLILPIRRSASLNSSLCPNGQFLVADILRISEEVEDNYEDYHVSESNKSGSGKLNLVNGPLGMRRSLSTGRFMFSRYEKGRSSMFPTWA